MSNKTIYNQIEKEALAIIIAAKKFHKILHGRRFRLQTDLRPLLTILLKAGPKNIQQFEDIVFVKLHSGKCDEKHSV